MDAMIEHKMSLRNCRRLWIGNWNEGKYNYPIMFWHGAHQALLLYQSDMSNKHL